MSRLVAIDDIEIVLPSGRSGPGCAVATCETFHTLRAARVALDPERDSLAALTGLGKDWAPRIAALFEAGIGVAGVQRPASGASAQAVERDGGAWHERTSPRCLAKDPAALADAVEGADMIYLGVGTLTSLAPRERLLILEGLAAVRGRGVRIAFAPALGPDQQPNSAEMRAVIADMAAQSDIVLTSFAAEARAFKDAGPAETLARYMNAGAGEVVVRDGRRGLLLSEGGAVPAGGTAAGDDRPRFTGVYLGARLAGADPQAAAEAAQAALERAIAAPGRAEAQSKFDVWRLDRPAAAAHRARRFARETVPLWLERALDAGDGPAAVAESFDETGRRTTLVQCRTVFTLAHLGRATGNQRLLEAALRVQGFVAAYLKDPDGGHRHSVAPDGSPLKAPESALRNSYDQGFALLALAELRRAGIGDEIEAEMEACWQFVVTCLLDPATGALWEDDRGAEGSEVRAQNPQMHMFEALLAAYEATGVAVWLDRARNFARLAEGRLIDPATGAVREFLGSDMDPLEGPQGTQREPGHQFEWAWLLRKHAGLRGTLEGLRAAGRMERFAQAHGVNGLGFLAGAPLAAVDAAGAVRDDTLLMWPLTEAGKVYAARAGEGDPTSADCARAIASTIFGRYFSPDGAPFWAKALDRTGHPVGEPGLTRLLYHVAIFVTEGARAGLWDLGADHRASGESRPEPHTTH